MARGTLQQVPHEVHQWRNTTMRWFRRLGLGVLVTLMVLVSCGLLYQRIATYADQRSVPAPGQLVDVGGYRLHLITMGTERGGPTVILDAAAGSTSAQWGWVQPAVSSFTQVVAYDRPGQGYSDAAPTPRDAQALVADLRTALHKTGSNGPYVLVGHSMGGLFMRTFAMLHPDEVAGLVLVDTRYLGIDDVVPVAERTPDNRAQLAWQLPLLAQLGIFRLQNINGEYIAQLPPPAAAHARAALASTPHWQGFVPDTYVADSAEALLRGGEQYGELPLIVLSAEQPDPYNFTTAEQRDAFTALQQQLATATSTHGQHRVVRGADHASIVTHEAYAQATIDTIHELVTTSKP